MKKLMIAAAIVCAAAISQASVFNWAFSEGVYTGTEYQTPGAQDLTGFKLYVFDAASWPTEVTAETFTTLALGSATPITASTQTFGPGYDFTTFSADGVGTSAPAGYADGDTINLMYVIVNAEETKYQALAGHVAADIYDVGGQGLPTAGKFEIDDLATGATGYFTQSGMVDIAPEPTSGLLLLLGVAGLALRRRHG